MSRTLNPEIHAVRRDSFVDAAQRLIQAKGYERMSVQDVLDELDASRGAFYHYFDSKAALLDAIVERLVDQGMATFGPAATAPDKSALDKFEALFGGIAQYKAERRDLLLGFMRAWYAEENTLIREHFRRDLVGRMEPLFTGIVEQGVAEGVFVVGSARETARVLVSLMQGMNEDAGLLFLDIDNGLAPLGAFESRVVAYVEAFERILGARPGSLRFPGTSVIRDWYRWSQEYRKDHS
jgi:AcrR family transcriptional regulator